MCRNLAEECQEASRKAKSNALVATVIKLAVAQASNWRGQLAAAPWFALALTTS
jgi:hypothetical protein